MSDLDTEDGLTGDSKIVAEAKRRFGACQEWESTSRKLFWEDVKFANGDSDNQYQWPGSIYRNRDIEDRPCLTINKTRQHNLQIINDGRQNKSSVKIRPLGNQSSYEAAEVFEGLVRHTEYISNAQDAYDTARKFQVEGGIGYWRVVTDYVGNDTFDQEIYIRGIKDPSSVYLDKNISEKDGSDARYGFIFDDMSLEEYRLAYPEYKQLASTSTLGNTSTVGWLTPDTIRVAEYYRKSKKKDRLITFTDTNTGAKTVVRESKLPQNVADAVIDDPATKYRTIDEDIVEWYLIAGEQIIDRAIWPGKYIPIIRIIGEETIIDGKLDRKGHTRNLKDPQRQYNYWTSASVEFAAMQSKTPWITPAKAVEGFETFWGNANRQNYAYLPYNHVDDTGEPIPAPTRQQPPSISPAYIEGMKISQQEMMMVSGQQQANFGEPGNEKSGKAINARQRQGENATYHFIDNEAIGLRYTGKILIDLYPKIYDTTNRVIKVIGEDGTESNVLIDPNARQAWLAEKQKEGLEAQIIFNPSVGEYDVMSDVGPAYATQRQEAFSAISQILTQAPELVTQIGDILFKVADFPLADKIAERLERGVPAFIKGEAPPPEVQQAQQQVQMMTGQMQKMQSLLSEMTQQLAEEKLKLKGKDQMRDIDAYKAITDRLETIIKHVAVTPKDNAQMLHDLMIEEHRASLIPVEAASAPVLQEAAQQ
jgi:hypothetical protein